MKNAFLIIDTQFDFCHPDGALFVPGAEGDVERMAGMIRRHADQIDHIVVTLDTHHLIDIAQPLFWEDTAGQHPAPFTRITAAEVDAGRWVPRFAAERAGQYVRDLEADGQFAHFIWPEHCLIGSRGAALHDTLMGALIDWSRQRERDYVAVPETQLHPALIADLERFETVYLMSEAKSRYVANSLGQMLNFAPGLVPKVVVVTDCMSDVTGLGHLADPIYAQARARGVRFTESSVLFS